MHSMMVSGADELCESLDNDSVTLLNYETNLENYIWTQYLHSVVVHHVL